MKIILKIDVGQDGEFRGDVREFNSKAELEAFVIDPDKVTDLAHSIFLRAEENGLFDNGEFDDGDTYNGDTTNDINA